MPVSLLRHIPLQVGAVMDLHPNSVLDVGCGFGIYGALLREYLDVWCAPCEYGEHRTRIDAIEVYEPYITGLHRSVYDGVFVGDALAPDSPLRCSTYDVILILDALEHFDRERGLELIAACRAASPQTLISVPVAAPSSGTVSHTLYFYSRDAAGNTETPHGQVQFSVSPPPPSAPMPVWRFYNFRTGTHFYTADLAEKANVENNMRNTYSLDGPGFYLAP